MKTPMAMRFRGFLPIVVDVECGGVDPQRDALLELGAVSLSLDENGLIQPDKEYHYHIQPFEGGHLNPAALAFNKIDPHHPFRFALPEHEALNEFFAQVRQECKNKGCTRAVLVGHNAWFDQHFLNAAIARNLSLKNPFHKFTSLDTATLSALAYGQTVLPKALEEAGIPYDTEEAHSALYDAQCTAALFCTIINKWKSMNDK